MADHPEHGSKMDKLLSALCNVPEFAETFAAQRTPVGEAAGEFEVAAELCAGLPLHPVLGNEPDRKLLAAIETWQEQKLPANMKAVCMYVDTVSMADHSRHAMHLARVRILLICTRDTTDLLSPG